MPHSLDLLDEHGAADAGTFAARAARVGDGALRLQAERGILVLTAAPLSPRALGDPSPTVLALRVTAVDDEVSCDVIVDAERLQVRGQELMLPDTAVRAAWAGVSPPRDGWKVEGEVSGSALRRCAESGIAAVAAALPAAPGEDLVRKVRGEVWSPAVPDLLGLPSGAAFAAETMGLLGADDDTGVVRLRSGWMRLSLRRGHVLVRRPPIAGLTPVRSTGGTRPNPTT